MFTHLLFLPLIWWLFWISLTLGAGGCAAPTPERKVPVDLEFSRTMSAARTAFSRGSIEEAAILYRRSLMRARAIDNPSAIADAAYNLAACYTREGMYAKARVLLKEAETETLRSHGDLADILLVEAEVARLEGDLEGASSLANNILSHPSSSPTNSHRLQVSLLRGHLACDQGDLKLAREELHNATKYATLVSNPELHARSYGLTGRIYLMSKEPEKAAQAFDREMEFLKTANQHRGMVRALQKAAEAYMSAGNSQAAGDRFFRAARSVFAQGNEKEAIRLGEMAKAAADASGDPQTVARVRALMEEIEEAVGKQSGP